MTSAPSSSRAPRQGFSLYRAAAFLVFGLLSLPWSIACIRAALGVSESFALMIALGVASGVSFLWEKHLRAKHRLLAAVPGRPWFVVSASIAVLLALSFFRLYHLPLAGLVSVGGGDASEHLYYAAQLRDGEVQTYNAMIVFHYYLKVLQQFFGVDSFAAVRLLFYSTLAVTITFVLLLYRRCLFRSAFAFVLAFLVFCLSAEYFVLPVFHYLQADGFYPQLFGFLPLLLAVLLVSYVPTAFGQFLLCIFWLIAQRYSYALSVPETLFALGIVFLLSARKGSTALYLLGSLGSFLLAALSYSRLIHVYQLQGAIRHFNVGLLNLLLLLAAGLFLFQARILEQGEQRAHARVFAVSAAVVFCSSLLFLLRSYLTEAQSYYLHKAVFYPALLVACLLPLLIAGSLRDLYTEREKGYLKQLVLLALSLALLAMLPRTIRPLRASYYERAAQQLPLELLQPLSDREAVAHIRKVLKSQGRQFGGYISEPRWAMSHFSNAELGFFRYRQQPLYRDPHVTLSPGYCVFWNASEDTLNRLRKVSQSWAATLVEELNENPGTQHISYQNPWSEKQKILAYLCL